MNKEWIQETNELLKEWEVKREALYDKRELLENELMDLDQHLTDLDKRIEAVHELISAYMKKHPTSITTLDNIRLGSLANKNYPEMLIEIAKQSPDGILTVEGMTDILVKADIGIDKNTIRHNVGNTLLRLSRRSKHFAKIGRGQFRFTNHIQTKKIEDGKKTKGSKGNKEPSGVRDAVKSLKERFPQISKKEVLAELLASGFDFHGKNPAGAVNFSWTYWGYSKEGKQQKLPNLMTTTKAVTKQPDFF